MYVHYDVHYTWNMSMGPLFQDGKVIKAAGLEHTQ
jgi:hypothetical protein